MRKRVLCFMFLLVLGVSVAQAGGDVKVRWNPTAEKYLSHYTLYRADGVGVYGQIADNLTSESYVDHVPNHDMIYNWVVTASNIYGMESAQSDPASVVLWVNHLPTVDLRSSATQVLAGSSVMLAASAEDDDGDVVSATWSLATDSTAYLDVAADLRSAILHLPADVVGIGMSTITVAVTDDDGSTVFVSLEVETIGHPTPPVMKKVLVLTGDVDGG